MIKYLLVVFFTFTILIKFSICGVNLTVASCIIQYSEVCASDFLKFYISTSDYPEKPLYLLKNSNPKLPPWINIRNCFKIIIHGYGGGGIEFNQTKNIQEEYLKVKSTNILSIDWGRLVSLPCYPSASVNTKQAGECISEFLKRLQIENSEFVPWNVHIIGFSLGAHVAGFASNSLERMIGRKVQRITGLDPALPLFATTHLNRKLDSTDAEFVDVIHTNVGIFGKIEPCGHVDFYVNGGQVQPNCNESQNIPLCSHMMANVYFKESITSQTGFWGVRCSSYFQFLFGWCEVNSAVNSDRFLMGEHCPEKSYGIMFLNTNRELPYAMGKV